MDILSQRRSFSERMLCNEIPQHGEDNLKGTLFLLKETDICK